MSEIATFIDILRGKTTDARQAQLRWAVCKSVDWDNRTMVAIGQTDELEYYDVMLGLGAVNMKPAKGAMCLLGILEGEEAAAFLLAAEKVEQIELLTADSFVIASKSDNLQAVLLDIIAEVAKIIVVQGTSPNVPALNAISNRVKQLLK